MTKKRLGTLVGEIDMSAYEKRGNAGASAGTRPQTGVGMVMGAIAGNSDIERKLAESQTSLEEATQRLAEYEGAELARKLDPRSIRRSRWANRDELNFKGPAWEAFKAELESAGGNVEAIKVRRVFDGQTPSMKGGTTPEYEIVYGHRRHRGCWELGLLVNAVVVDSMDDRALFAEMDRENRHRENLSAWEQGRMYNHALKEGLYPSLRRLAEELGVNLSDASRCCKLAQLPDVVVQAFPSPMVIQVRWAKPLADGLQSDPDGMLERARALQANRDSLAPSDIVERLLNQPAKDAKPSIPIQARGQTAASLRIGPKGRAVVEFEAGALEPARHDALVKLIADFLNAS